MSNPFRRDRGPSREAPSSLEVLLLRLNSSSLSTAVPGSFRRRIDRKMRAPAATRARRGARGARGRERRVSRSTPRRWCRFALDHAEGQPKRFSTWFFVGLADATQVRVDAVRSTRTPGSRGCRAAAQRAREIELPPPTFVTLSTPRREPPRPRRTLEAARASEPLVVSAPAGPRAGRNVLALSADAGWEQCDASREARATAAHARVGLALRARLLGDPRERSVERAPERSTT